MGTLSIPALSNIIPNHVAKRLPKRPESGLTNFHHSPKIPTGNGTETRTPTRKIRDFTCWSGLANHPSTPMARSIFNIPITPTRCRGFERIITFWHFPHAMQQMVRCFSWWQGTIFSKSVEYTSRLHEMNF